MKQEQDFEKQRRDTAKKANKEYLDTVRANLTRWNKVQHNQSSDASERLAKSDKYYNQSLSDIK